jgi:hypothetical protein
MERLFPMGTLVAKQLAANEEIFYNLGQMFVPSLLF